MNDVLSEWEKLTPAEYAGIAKLVHTRLPSKDRGIFTHSEDDFHALIYRDCIMSEVLSEWEKLTPEYVDIAKLVHTRLPNECRQIFKYGLIFHIGDDFVLIVYPFRKDDESSVSFFPRFTELLKLSRPAIEKTFKKVINRSLAVEDFLFIE
jgi:hypothetical protein